MADGSGRFRGKELAKATMTGIASAKKTYHHGDLRQALITRAVEVIDQSGVADISLRSLARDLGVSHGAPTRHFRNKVGLLEAIALQGVEGLFNAVSNSSNSAGTADDGSALATAKRRLVDFSHAYVQWAHDNPGYHRTLRNPDVMRHASSALRERLQDMAHANKVLIADAQRHGWRRDTPIETLFLHVVSLTAGMALVVTDPSYRNPIPDAPNEDVLRSALEILVVD